MRYKGSTTPLPEIARELGVEGVVEGSVVRSGGRVRIIAQLIHAPTDRHLWAHSYERRLEDVLALQDEVSRAIAEEIRLTVATESARRPARVRAVNAEAYDAYLLGRHHYNQRSPQSLEKATAYFQSAIARDPGFAPAYEALATNYGPRIVSGDVAPDRARAEMKAAALKALELDPGLAEARADLAATLAYEWDWDGAEREYRRALEIDPNSLVANGSYGWYLYALGRFEEMLAVRRRALELDPLDVAVNQSLARALAVTGQDEAAAAQWKRTVELDPNRLRAQVGFAFFLLEQGHTDLGWQQLERARALQPDEPVVLAGLATAYLESGKPDQAPRLLARLKEVSARRYVSPWFPALVHTALGEKDSAFALLEKAFVAKDPLLIRIQNLDTAEGLSPPQERAAALRADPRYADLVRRMGLPRRDAAGGGPSTRASGAPEERR
jgi:Tfp pilus assembly protein PilF